MLTMARAVFMLVAAAVFQQTVGGDHMRAVHSPRTALEVPGWQKWGQGDAPVIDVRTQFRRRKVAAWVPVLAGTNMGNRAAQTASCNQFKRFNHGKTSMVRRDGIAMAMADAAQPMGLEALETKLQLEIKKLVKGMMPAKPLEWKEKEELFQREADVEDKE